MEIGSYLHQLGQVIERLDQHIIERVVAELYRGFLEERMVFLIGNGGSAANASHFAQDLAKGVLKDVKDRRLRALSLTDNTAYISAVANDDGYEHVFERQLHTFGNHGDILIAISGSGNSANIIRAVEYAQTESMTVIAFTGYDGGQLRRLANIAVHIPVMEMCTVESIHSVLFHLIVNLLRQKITGYSVDVSCFAAFNASAAR
jgi:D-sedoheptulose 7-phosphate isomerase